MVIWLNKHISKQLKEAQINRERFHLIIKEIACDWRLGSDKIKDAKSVVWFWAMHFVVERGEGDIGRRDGDNEIMEMEEKREREKWSTN